MAYTSKEDARDLGRTLANMPASLQAVVFATMTEEGRRWQREWDDACARDGISSDKDLPTHQWEAIGQEIAKLNKDEAEAVRRMIRIIAANMGY
jgi:hypothetical protein